MEQAANKILIVDDLSQNITIVSAILRNEGYELSSLTTGLEVLPTAIKTKPDLILLDVLMPGMDGLAVCRQLKAEPQTADIPVIFVTAQEGEKGILDGFGAGGVDYVRKPFIASELIARVRVHTELRQSRLKLEGYARQLSEANRRLEELAHFDPLTGLPNRRLILSKIQEEQVRFQRTGKPFSIAILDVDHFKRINDTYGHNAGDSALKHITSLVKGLLRQQDYCGRWGGEEFLFLLPETPLKGALVLAENVRQEIAGHPTLISEDLAYDLTVTLGVAEIGASGIDDTIANADRALYRGKDGGRNRVVSA